MVVDIGAERARLDRIEEQRRRDAERARLDRADIEAKVGGLETDVATIRQAAYKTWSADYDRRQKLLADLKQLADEQPSMPRLSLDEAAAELSELDAYASKAEARERDEMVKTIDEGERNLMYHPGRRDRWLAAHPGGAGKCTCTPHRLWRREA